MDKDKLQKSINLGSSQREIAKEFNVSHATTKYWLNKFNLKTLIPKSAKVDSDLKEKICAECKRNLPIDNFYWRNNKTRKNRCKYCMNSLATKKRTDIKIKMIEYKGSKCQQCKLKLQATHPAVFEFHHTNPLIKDKNFGGVKGWTWERITKELDSCDLLCANCHRIEHAKITQRAVMAQV